MLNFTSRILTFLSNVFLFPEKTPVFQELLIDKNPYYRKAMGEYWHLDGTFVTLEYTDELKKELEAYKYYSRKHKKDLFLPHMSECFRLFCLENTGKDAVMTTVPIHFFSRVKRGYNHSEVLAEGLAKREDSPFLDLLKKSRLTKHQARLGKSERLRNVRNSFSLRAKHSKTIQ